jgi:AcrR family transcriptional regulator
MARPARADRLEQITDAALAAFTEKGFRLTQVADVARLAGVAPGTIYLFAESKEALFWIALARTMGRPLSDVSCETPTVNELQQRFAPNGASPSLTAYLAEGDGTPPPLETVIGEFWETVERAAPAIKLVERCASDWPELAEAFYAGLRPTVLKNLAEYLARGAEAGICRAVPDPPMAARLIMETIAWFAMHRRGDPDGRFYDPAAARSVTLDALVHAYGPEPRKEKK